MVYKSCFVVILLYTCVFARPQDPAQKFAQTPQNIQNNPPALLNNPASAPIPIVSQTESVGVNGTFNYSYETGNGIKVEESGYVKHVTGLRARGNFPADDTTPDEDDILVQTGSFAYTAPDGTVISLKYIADENGFQPTGDHLPTPPPIPVDIQRFLPPAGQPAEARAQDVPSTAVPAALAAPAATSAQQDTNLQPAPDAVTA